jgi:hypothetical protein
MPTKGVREISMFRWLAGGQAPDFRTLNDFRGKLLTGVMEDIFVKAVKLLKAKGYIKGENYFLDGTKIESASGWKKSVEKNDRKLDDHLHASITMIDGHERMRTEKRGSGILRSWEGRRGIPARR